MFVTTRHAGDVIKLTLPDEQQIVIKVQGFRVGDDGRIAGTLAFDLPDEVLINERQRGPVRVPRSRV